MKNIFRDGKAGILATGLAGVLAASSFVGCGDTKPASPRILTSEESEERVTHYFTTKEWKDFTSTIGKFKVRFPGYPQHKSETLSSPVMGSVTAKMHVYRVEDSERSGYMVSFITYSQETDLGSEANFEGAVNGMLASNPGSELVSSDFTTFNGYKALDFFTKNEDYGFCIKGRMIPVGRKNLYQLMRVYDKDKGYNEEDYKHFIDSFELLK